MRNALEKLCRVSGPRHPVTLDTELDLIQTLLGQRRYSEAELLGTKVMALIEEDANNPRSGMVLAKSMMAVGRMNTSRSRPQ